MTAHHQEFHSAGVQPPLISADKPTEPAPYSPAPYQSDYPTHPHLTAPSLHGVRIVLVSTKGYQHRISPSDPTMPSAQHTPLLPPLALNNLAASSGSSSSPHGGGGAGAPVLPPQPVFLPQHVPRYYRKRFANMEPERRGVGVVFVVVEHIVGRRRAHRELFGDAHISTMSSSSTS